MTDFHAVRLPEDVERGAAGGPRFSTTVVPLASGAEKRNQNWSRPRGRWDVGYGIQTKEDYERLIHFFMARRGRAYGFLFKDWSDFEAEASYFGTGDGTTTVFQLSKRYTDSGNFTFDRPIKRPVSPIQVFKDAVLQTVTTHYTVDYTTGLVTFVTAPANATVLTWTGEFDVPVRFDQDELVVTLEHFDAGEVPSVPVIELRK